MQTLTATAITVQTGDVLMVDDTHGTMVEGIVTTTKLDGSSVRVVRLLDRYNDPIVDDLEESDLVTIVRAA